MNQGTDADDRVINVLWKLVAHCGADFGHRSCHHDRWRRRSLSGEEVEKYYRDGHIRQIAEYCESDVVNIYRVWLRYELFRGRLTDAEFQASEQNLVDFIKARGNTKPHLC